MTQEQPQTKGQNDLSEAGKNLLEEVRDVMGSKNMPVSSAEQPQPVEQPRLTAEEIVEFEMIADEIAVDGAISAAKRFAQQEVAAKNQEWKDRIRERINEVNEMYDHTSWNDGMTEIIDTAYHRGQIAELENLLK